MERKVMARLRLAMVAYAREDVQSVHFPLGVTNVKLYVVSTYGTDFVETVTACDYCGAEIIPNGRTETVREHEPGSTNPTTRVVPAFTPYTCCPTGMTRYQHSRGYCCCPTGLYREYAEKGRGTSR